MPTLYTYTQYDRDNETVFRLRCFYSSMYSCLRTLFPQEVKGLFKTVRRHTHLVWRGGAQRHEFYRVPNFAANTHLYRTQITDASDGTLLLDEVTTYDEMCRQSAQFTDVRVLSTEERIRFATQGKNVEIKRYILPRLH